MVRVAGVFLLFPDRPLIPYKFLECLRPRKPAPGRGRHRGLGRGWGPSPASSPHHQQLTKGRSPAESGCSQLSSPLWGSPASALHPKPVFPLLLQPLTRGFPLQGEDAQGPKPPIPAPKARPALGLQAVGRTSAHNPHHVPKATRPPPHCSQLQLSLTPPSNNLRAGSWTQRFAEPFPKSRG